MATQLNIKDPETVALAHRLAKATGKPMTTVIREALEREERAQDERIAESLAVVKAISDRVRSSLPPEWQGKSSQGIIAELYDDRGLPI
ncbi:MAG: type II toxin-antitoxin system VapB family antitoxin [Sphingomonas sp.]|uniref:type II toxin-antitoxin system VapB family antitoxin n=1 Tax=Sphingomonas sp. TaxID=28214 RepID=UPI0025F695BD|nr:type II toxin-antitoxin system VapB family antitoxin [Sphingomonas sp.]MBY0284835.1 type II toxin-antitoxin system VapB family antitoxin [Sphingomonas sp.]